VSGTLGIDVGGTNTKLVHLGPEGPRPLEPLPTRGEDGPEDYFARLATRIQAEGLRPEAIGLAFAGLVDLGGRVIQAPNLARFEGVRPQEARKVARRVAAWASSCRRRPPSQHGAATENTIRAQSAHAPNAAFERYRRSEAAKSGPSRDANARTRVNDKAKSRLPGRSEPISVEQVLSPDYGCPLCPDGASCCFASSAFSFSRENASAVAPPLRRDMRRAEAESRASLTPFPMFRGGTAPRTSGARRLASKASVT